MTFWNPQNIDFVDLLQPISVISFNVVTVATVSPTLMVVWRVGEGHVCMRSKINSSYSIWYIWNNALKFLPEQHLHLKLNCISAMTHQTKQTADLLKVIKTNNLQFLINCLLYFNCTNELIMFEFVHHYAHKMMQMLSTEIHLFNLSHGHLAWLELWPS